MRDIEGIEKAVEMLRPHWAEIEDHFEKENCKFKRLLHYDTNHLGRALKCHLIIEHYLDRFLGDHYGIHLEDARLSFFQKAKLLPDRAAAAAVVKPGILNINAVRNRLSHQLGHAINRSDLGPVYEFLGVARRGIEFDPIDAIEAFTTVACTWMIVPPQNLKSLFIQAFADVKINTRDED